ncbi:translation initiation factor IF-1 [Candidatus Gracilibacteria bacterium]|nr:translation initiation factor IF-1 [Candidatus Gracilibacteria bacterium]
MGKEDMVQVEGVVIEPLPGTVFRVELSDGRIINARLAGKMRMHYIKILPGDRVDIEMSTYDLTKGRITYRHKS